MCRLHPRLLGETHVDAKLPLGLLMIAVSLLSGCSSEGFAYRPTDNNIYAVCTDDSYARAGNSDPLYNQQIRTSAAILPAPILTIYPTGGVSVYVIGPNAFYPQAGNNSLTQYRRIPPSTIVVVSTTPSDVGVYMVGNNISCVQISNASPLPRPTEPALTRLGAPSSDPVASVTTSPRQEPTAALQPTLTPEATPQANSLPTATPTQDRESCSKDSIFSRLWNWFINGIKEDKPSAVIVAVCTPVGILVTILAWLFPRQTQNLVGRAFPIVTS
jgi:hypothetical protein